jgi:type I restriction enzyme S subunit
MKLETFFEKFDQFADAPRAVGKMRELVLDLAVNGKLTDRDLEKESVASEYSDEPSSDILPANWRLLNFGKFCDIQGGNQPPKSQFSDEPRPGYVRMFQIRDLGERPVPVYISKESTNRFCREGEILIGRYGASVGKVFWAQDGAYNVALAKFIFPEDALLPAFAFWVLKSEFFQAEIAGASRSAQAGFNKGDLAAIDFPLPPLAEQKRIVAKVDELMALCDRLEAQQQEREARHAALARASLARFADAPTPANLNLLFHSSFPISPSDLRKSILTLAVQGKLAPSVENKHVVLGEVIELISGQHLLAHEHNEEGKGIPYLTGPSDFGPKHPVPTRWSETPKVVAEPGDILVTVKGSGVGKTNKLVTEKTAISRQLMAVRVTGADPDFVHLVLMNAADHFQESMTGIAIPGIGRKDVLELEAELPPLAEQRRIVAKVEHLMTLVDALETKLAASRAAAEKLLTSLVAELTGTPSLLPADS